MPNITFERHYLTTFTPMQVGLSSDGDGTIVMLLYPGEGRVLEIAMHPDVARRTALLLQAATNH